MYVCVCLLAIHVPNFSTRSSSEVPTAWMCSFPGPRLGFVVVPFGHLHSDIMKGLHEHEHVFIALPTEDVSDGAYFSVVLCSKMQQKDSVGMRSLRSPMEDFLVTSSCWFAFRTWRKDSVSVRSLHCPMEDSLMVPLCWFAFQIHRKDSMSMRSSHCPTEDFLMVLLCCFAF